MKIKIAPSILAAKRDILNIEVLEVQNYSDIIHVDIMDGKFVPPTTFTSSEIRSINGDAKLDVHLMVEYPLKYIDEYRQAKIISFHIESKDDVQTVIDKLKMLGIKVSIAIKPNTSIDGLKPYLSQLDMVLIMTVEPGWGGQKFMTSMLDKIKDLRKIAPNLDIEVDGGINEETIVLARGAGANVFVAGSSIFNKSDRVLAINALKSSIQ